MADNVTIYVGNIDNKVTIQEVFEFLSRFGTVTNMNWPANFIGCCWITANETDARCIIDQHKKMSFNGRLMFLERSDKRLNPLNKQFIDLIQKRKESKSNQWSPQHPHSQPEPGEVFNQDHNHSSSSPPPLQNAGRLVTVSGSVGRSRSPPPVPRLNPPPRLSAPQHSSDQSSCREIKSASAPHCFDFVNKGQCQYGNTCKYPHISLRALQTHLRDHNLTPNDSNNNREIASSLPNKQIVAPHLPIAQQINPQRATSSSVCDTNKYLTQPQANTTPSDLTTDILARHNEGLHFIPGFKVEKETIKLECKQQEVSRVTSLVTPDQTAVVATPAVISSAPTLPTREVHIVDCTPTLPTSSPNLKPANDIPSTPTQAIGALCTMEDRGAGPVDLTKTPATVRRSVLSARRQSVDLNNPPIATAAPVFKAVGGCLQLECDTGPEEAAPSVSMTPSQGRGRTFTQPAWMTEKLAPAAPTEDKYTIGHVIKTSQILTTCGQFDDAEVDNKSSQDPPAPTASSSSAATGIKSETLSRTPPPPISVSVAPPAASHPIMMPLVDLEEVEVDYTPPSDDEEEEEEVVLKEEEVNETARDTEFSAPTASCDNVKSENDTVPFVAAAEVKQSVALDETHALSSVVSASSLTTDSNARPVAGEESETAKTNTSDTETTTLPDLPPQNTFSAVVEEDVASVTETAPIDPAHYLVPSAELVGGEKSGLLWYLERNEANTTARKRKVSEVVSQCGELSKTPRVTFADGVAVAVVEEEDHQQQQHQHHEARSWKRKIMKEVEHTACRVT